MNVDHHNPVEDATEIGSFEGIVRDNVTYSGRIRTSGDIVPIDAVIIPLEHDTKEHKKEPQCLAHTTHLLSLAVFGIAGVMSRYALKLLSEHKFVIRNKEVSLASDKSFVYPDLLANMIGSFLMGWLGVVFKGDISKISDQLAVGLSAGFLGCLTTFSGWNQSILNLSASNEWGSSVLCAFIGLILSGFSVTIGVWTAKICKRNISSIKLSNLNKSKFLIMLFTTLLVTLVLLWSLFAALEAKTFKEDENKAELFLSGLVGPFGVWLRWYLARLNGRGFGKNQRLKWIPFGTLIANVLAACVMAALATLNEMVNTRNVGILSSGIQLGLLGSLSTVSTFMSELYEMGRTCHPLRMISYAIMTILPSFGFGTIIYSVPIWVRNRK